MTKEEAIEILKLFKQRLEESVSTELGNDIQAFEMAISALENNYNSAEQTDGDLISRDYVLSKFKEQCERCGKYKENNGVMCRCCALDDAIDYVEDAPSIINGVPSAEKTAKWIFEFSRGKDKYYQCSICGRRALTDNDVVKDFPYCHCGAKMEESQDE